jgi:hypothetical protein
LPAMSTAFPVMLKADRPVCFIAAILLDVAYDGEWLFVANGYAAPAGDFIMRAKWNGVDAWIWDECAWGGDGTANGKFKVAHGLVWYDGFLHVANKNNHRIDKFDVRG